MSNAADLARVVTFVNSEAHATATKIRQLLREFEETTGAVVPRDGVAVTRVYREHRPSEVEMVEVVWVAKERWPSLLRSSQVG